MASTSKSSATEKELCQMLRRAAEDYGKNINVKFAFQPIIQEIDKRTSVCITKIGGDALAVLGTVLGQRPFPNLTSVCIVDCNLDKRIGVVKLCRALVLGNLSSLETLSVSNNGMEDKDLMALAGALGSGKCSRLKHLSLGGDRDVFQARGATAVAEVLASSEALPVLEDLSVRGVEEEEGMLAIFTALENRKVKPVLNSLDFQRCHIGLGAASILARALEFSPNFSALIKLDLTGSRTVGDEEVTILCQAFRSKNLHHLFCLGLANLSMGDKGFIEIASVLRAGHLRGLHYLYAIDCPMTETSAKALIEAYTANSSLVVDMAVDWPGFAYQSRAHSLLLRNETLLEQQQSEKDLQRGAGGVDTSIVEFDDQRSPRPSSSVILLIKKIRGSRWKITKMLFSIKRVLGKKKTRIVLRIASLRSQRMTSDRERTNNTVTVS